MSTIDEYEYSEKQYKICNKEYKRIKKWIQDQFKSYKLIDNVIIYGSLENFRTSLEQESMKIPYYINIMKNNIKSQVGWDTKESFKKYIEIFDKISSILDDLIAKLYESPMNMPFIEFLYKKYRYMFQHWDYFFNDDKIHIKFDLDE